jgi:hypothetical protein
MSGMKAPLDVRRNGATLKSTQGLEPLSIS